jgi:hypothetical protein
MKYIILIIIGGLFFFNCTKDQSIIPSVKTINNDSLARVAYNKYLSRIISANVGFCMGCHDGSGPGPGPGDFRTYDDFKLTVLKPGNLVRVRGLNEMSECKDYGCLTVSQKDTLSTWLKDYFNL